MDPPGPVFFARSLDASIELLTRQDFAARLPRMEALGIDIGNVIIAGGSAAADTDFFTGDHLRTPAIPGAFDVISRLVRERFGERVYLISKAYKRVEKRTIEWLQHHDFANATGIAPERWHFVRERIEKGPLCGRLGITLFIDDKAENLEYAKQHGATHLYLFGSADAYPTGHPCPDWAGIAALLLPA